MEYLQKIRMEEAKHLLKTTNQKVYEIAEQLGIVIISILRFSSKSMRKCPQRSTEAEDSIALCLIFLEFLFIS